MAKQVEVVEVNDIVATADIARMLGVTSSAVSTWRRRDTRGFPQPFTMVANDRIPLWRKSQIVHWWSQKHATLINALRDMED